MNQSWKDQVKLPAPITEAIQQLCDDTAEKLGDQLQSILLYGGIAKGEFDENTSNVNILFALKQVQVSDLEKLHRPIQRARRQFRLSYMVLSDKDLQRSTDVFPIKFSDIQKHHIVLHGSDVMQGLNIEQEHLRLRCEQEMKNLLMRLRNFYTQRSQRLDRIEQTLTSMLSSFLIATDTLLFLKTGQYSVTKNEIIQAAGSQLDLKITPLQKVLQLKQGNYEPTDQEKELKQLYEAFMSVVEQAGDIADQLED